MGRYDKEVLSVIELLKQSEKNEFQEICSDIFNSYERMKELLIIEHTIPEIINRLYLIQQSDTFEKQKELILRLINDLQPRLYDQNQLVELASNISNNCISLLSTLYKISVTDIIEITKNIYIKKNSFYGDIWYNRKEEGICRDMGRKIVRLSSVLNDNPSKDENETLYDTLCDLINYCCLMITYAVYIH